MAELREEPEAATEQALDQASPAAVSLALGRTSKSGKALDAKAAAFLTEQTTLIRLQTEHLHEQRELQTSRLRLGRWRDRFSLALQALTAVVGLAIAGAVGVMAWQAHEDHGLTIAAFSVPPDLAQRGLTGQVVASKVQDRLSALQAQTVSARPGSTYADDWGSDIKVEIPETGVSIGELDRYLRQWLGSETKITGEVVRTPTGLAITARAGANPGETFQGADADFEKLVGQAAEAVYAQTQPYRYAVYLASRSRSEEAVEIFQRLTRSGNDADRAWAYAGWATLLLGDNQPGGAVDKAEASLSLDPRLYPARLMLDLALDVIGRDEEQLAATRRERALLGAGGMVGLPKAASAGRRRFLQAVEAYLVGDYRKAASILRGFEGAPIDFEGRGQAYNANAFLASSLAWDHDISASRRIAGGVVPSGILSFVQPAELDDWATVAVRWRQPQTLGLGYERATRLEPYAAIAFAHLGRFPEAEALVEQTPLDCDRCFVARGQIAALKHDWPAADRWFAEAARRARSLPFADTEWGRAMLAKGDDDGAIEKLSQAHRIGPHYADPLELWGEALMRRGDYAGAVGKFAEADKDAPKWGRNHMVLGEALMLSGRYAEARAQYVAAHGMDLSKPDRAALNVLLARTASGRLLG